MLFAHESDAQVKLENYTSCPYVVKVNAASSPCMMGMGPVVTVAPGAMLTVPTPPGTTSITGYGINIAPPPGGVGPTPIITGRPPCGFPAVITLPATDANACAATVTVFEYHGKKLVIK